MSIWEFYGWMLVFGLGAIGVMVMCMGLYFAWDDRQHAKHISMKFELALLEMDRLYGPDRNDGE